MNEQERDILIESIEEREKLRPISRIARLFRAPRRTIPYYVLAAASHIKPFLLTFRTPWGEKMTCFLPEGNTFLYYGYAEANLTNFFLRYIQEGMTCIDVGSHIGSYTMLFSKLTGPTGRVHSFEPTSWTFELLVRNTHSLENVITNNKAVAKAAGKISFLDYGPGFGAYNTADKQGAPALTQIPKVTEVMSLSLDEYCRDQEIFPVDIIKIDAEGYEYHVLSGMTTLLKKKGTRPLITLEVAGGKVWEENRNLSFTALSENGYHAYDIHTSGLIRPHVPRLDYEYDNILFVPQERLSMIAQFLAP